MDRMRVDAKGATLDLDAAKMLVAFARAVGLVAQTPQSLRSFSVTATAQKYKLKTHSGTRKRYKALPSGLFKRVSMQPGL